MPARKSIGSTHTRIFIYVKPPDMWSFDRGTRWAERFGSLDFT
jgi:hypothetical protein